MLKHPPNTFTLPLFFILKKWIWLFFFFPVNAFSQNLPSTIQPLKNYKDGRIFTFSEQNKYWLTMQDSLGFIWGYNKENEVVRYDGEEFFTFISNPSDSNTIQTVSSSPPSYLNSYDGKVWIKQKGALDRFDSHTRLVEHFHQRIWSIDSLGLSQYNRLMEDSKGNVWIGGGARGLFVLRKDEKTIQKVKRSQHIFLLFEDLNEEVWCITGSVRREMAFSKIDADKLELTERIGIIPVKNIKVEKDFFWNYQEATLINPNENIYLILAVGKAFLFDIKNKNLLQINNGLDEGEEIFSICKDSSAIIVGTSHNRILEFNSKSNSFSPFVNLSIENKEEKILQLFRSNEGILWVTTSQKTYQILPKKTLLNHISYPEDIINTNAAAGHHLLVKFGGEIYFNTKSGLKPVIEKTGVKSIPLDFNRTDFAMPDSSNKAKNYPPINFYNLTGLLFKEDTMTNTLWMLMYQFPYATKFFQFDSLGNRIDYYYCEGRRSSICTKDQFMDIDIDLEGNIWLAGWQKIVRFNPTDYSFLNLMKSRDSKPKLNNRFVTAVLVDKDQKVWIGYNARGVSKYDPQTEEIDHFMYEFENLNSIINNQWVNDMIEDKSGNIWIGSVGGLSKWDPATKTFSRYNKINGLPATNIKMMGEDDIGNIWFVSSNYLSLYTYEDSNFYSFNEKDGVEIRDHKAFFKDDDNNLFFQTEKDIVAFKSEDVKIDNYVPPLYFKDFSLSNDEYKGQFHVSDFSKKIDLTYDQKDFTIQYSALEYLFPELISFKFQLKGYDEKWRLNRNKREVTYTNLDHGDYTFLLKCINRHGIESTIPLTLTISISPPWYRTWWAYSLWLFLLVGTLYWFYRFQLTRQLAQAEAKRLKELDVVKSKLYTNITHEFRTPLTVILGMVEQVRTDPKNNFKEGLTLIGRNGKKLLLLINQLLDLSKLQSGNMPMHYLHGDIVSFVKYITESFHSYADSKDIRLHFLCELDELEMDHEPEKLQNLISNLLSNAIKFTPSGGDIYLTIEKIKLNELSINVRDTGMGISEEELSHIFDRFYQVDNSVTKVYEGTGIGLSLCKELVGLMDGNITVESELGKGSKFIIVLPIAHELKGKETKVIVPDLSELKNTFLPDKPMTILPDDYVPPHKRPLLLLIDDNLDVISYLSSLLSTNYEVITALDGDAGIEKAIESIPDLIISDVMMPKKDGFEVCEFLKNDERTNHIPIIILTAKAGHAHRIEGLTFGADAYISKPFQKEELLVRIEKLIELRKQLQLQFGAEGAFQKLAKNTRPNKEEIFIQKLLSIIEDRYDDEHFGVPELCKQATLSRSQLFRKLKAITGKSATQLIRSIRLSKAKDFLQTTNLSISEIAFQVGFSNPSYFTKVFHEEFGVTPSEFRG